MEKPKEKGFLNKAFSIVGLGSLFASDSKLQGINENFHDFIKLALDRELIKGQQSNGLH